MSNLKKNVEQIVRARGLTQSELATRLGFTSQQLADFLEAPPKRKETIIHNLSRELLVPEVFLFAEGVQVPNLAIPDFRLSHPHPGGYSRRTLHWIEFAESIREIAPRLSKADKSLSLSSIIGGLPIPKAAAKLRDALSFSEAEQLEFQNARSMFSALRERTERLNVFVLQLSFPESDGTGFSISGSPYDVIALNTRHQIHARRLFTLAHEIFHCSRKESGVSDWSVARNDIEKRCNAFAANFLAPSSLVRHVAGSTVAKRSFNITELGRIASALNISMYATLLRLIELDIYSDSALSAWNAYISGKGDPEGAKKGGGKRQEEWKYKLSKYGFKFATVFGTAEAQREFDELEFYQFSGIKPKYQKSYLTQASKSRPEDADVDED